MAPVRPRIVHVYKDYWPPIVGGIEKTVHWLAHGCADQYDVEVLVCARGARGGTEHDGPIRIIKAAQWGRFASAPLAPSFPLLLRRHAADILHFHHPNPTGELSYLLARPRGRVVVTYHSDIVRQRMGLKAYAPFLRRFLRCADAILPTSPNYIRSSVFLREVEARCQVVPLGIALEQYAATPDRLEAAARLRGRFGAAPLILFVGQFREYKGLPFLLRALASIPEARAVLIGDGAWRPVIEEERRRLGLEERVLLPGNLPDAEVIPYYHACDVFALPSHRRSEAFGLVQIEAMACGKPVVSTRLDTGVPFVNRDGETGLVVEPGDVESLARALRTLIGDAALRRRLGEAARRRAHAEFSREVMVERVKSVYASLLDRGAAR